MKIGFVGLGRMGERMAQRLVAAGYDLLVFDSNPEAIRVLVEQGAVAAQSLDELSQRAEVILLSLPTPDVVEDVANRLKKDGVRVIIDLSTTGPEVASRVATDLKVRGVTMIDAPVSGGITGAEDGTLTIMVSGDGDALAAVTPCLQTLGKVYYLGDKPGQAQAMKVINNTLCAVANISAFEGLVLGSKLGLDLKMMLGVINSSSGRSFATEVKVPQCILDRSFPMRFSTRLLEKDVGLCLDEAERLGVSMPVSVETRRFLKQGIDAGFGDVDYAELITIIENQADARFGIA